MIKNFIISIWSAVALVIFGVIVPPFIFHENYLVYQILFSTLLISIYTANEHFKYQNLYDEKKVVHESLNENAIILKNSLDYQESLNSILYDVTLKLSEEPKDERALLNFILAKAIEAIPDGEFGSILTLNEEGQFAYVASLGYDFGTLRHIRFNKEETFLWLGSTGIVNKPVIIRDLRSFNEKHLDPVKYQQHIDLVKIQANAVISSPIFLDGQLYGILNIDSMNENGFTENDVNLARFLTTHISFILKNRQLLEKAYYLSIFDKLTSIYNRTYFEDVFGDFQNKAFSHNKKFALVLMDLNYLKKINDTFGHIIGDTALKTFADGVKKHLSASDVFARYGGDEFIALLDNSTSEKAKEKFDQIVSYFDDINIEYNGAMIPIQFSYGVSEAPGESMILDILVKIADERMYDNKKYLKLRNQEDPRFITIR